MLVHLILYIKLCAKGYLKKYKYYFTSKDIIYLKKQILLLKNFDSKLIHIVTVCYTWYSLTNLDLML